MFRFATIGLVVFGMTGAVPALARRVAQPDHQISHRQWKLSSREVFGQATLDLTCSEDELEVVTVATMNELPDRIGIRGCDKQATYVRKVDTGAWVLTQAGVGPSTAPVAPTDPAATTP